MRQILVPALAAVALALARGADAAPPVDLVTVNRITDQAFNHSEIPDTASYLFDRIGARMTNSPGMRLAEAYTQQRFRDFGLSRVHTEGFEFGRGWWIESAHARLVAPRPIDLRSIPIAWTPATNGALVAPVIVAPMKAERDFADWRGKLAGRIVLASFPAPPREDEPAPSHRLDEAQIAKLDKLEQPTVDPEADQRQVERWAFRQKLDAFLGEEGALALVTMSRSEGRLVHGEGYGYRVGHTAKLPGVEIGAEDYRRIARLAKTGEVKLEIDSRVHFEDADHNAYNVIAEIPGRDARAGYVMAGAHLDSWVAGDGAADNGAGSLVVLEAARILASLDVKPKRTIRFALWAGEEQGLLGSAAYVRAHVATRPPNPAAEALDAPVDLFADTYPVTALPGYNDLAAYFNLDNGSGKVRGIYTEGNVAVVPVFREWLAPFAAAGAASVVASTTGGTDHVFFSRLGLPAFEFIQDPLDYETRVHHTDLDTYDHLRIDDLRQAAAVMATMLLDAANADAPLPRKALPTAPKRTDPFGYVDPAKK